MADIMQDAAIARLNMTRMTSDEKLNEFAQQLTFPETAKLVVSLFSEMRSGHSFIGYLDLGADSDHGIHLYGQRLNCP